MEEVFQIPYLLREGAVLQRNRENLFWAYTTPKKKVNFSYEGFETNVISDEKGYFLIKLPPHEVSENIEFCLSSEGRQLLIKDICFGDVFLLGGQSNMQLWIGRLKTRYPNEIKEAHNSLIRFFEVPQVPVFTEIKQELGAGQWRYAIGKELETLSGIGYFFAKRYFEKTGIPVGLVSTAVGGTPINSWLSEQSLRQMGLLPQNFAALKNTAYLAATQQLDERYQEQYLDLAESTDKGLLENWESPAFNDSDWKEVFLNKEWDKEKLYPGVLWLRKNLKIPSIMIGKEAEFRFGTFSDADDIFVNGSKVGSTDYKYPPRNYAIGKLPKYMTIVIRLKIFNFPGGIRTDKEHKIITENETLDLDSLGSWKIKRSSWLPERKEQFFLQYEPTGLFNGMIAPLKNLKFTAILWYQGESDGWHPENYGLRFCKMIQEWRDLFEQPNLPFLFVQLPNCGTETNAQWAEIRDEQKSALILNQTAMVVALDYGENNDLHPLDKKAIADDLYDVYCRVELFPNGYCSGPLALKVQYSANELHVSFQTYGKQLVAYSKGYFTIVEGDREEVISDHVVVGNEIRIRLPSGYVPSRESRLRYNWSNTPIPFVRNEDGSAAAPFELKIRF